MGKFSGRLLAWFAAAFGNIKRHFYHGGNWWELCDEGKCAVVVDGDDRRDCLTFEFCCFLVVCFYKLHDGQAMLAKSGTYGRGRGSLCRRQIKLDNGFNFANGHMETMLNDKCQMINKQGR